MNAMQSTSLMDCSNDEFRRNPNLLLSLSVTSGSKTEILFIPFPLIFLIKGITGEFLMSPLSLLKEAPNIAILKSLSLFPKLLA